MRLKKNELCHVVPFFVRVIYIYIPCSIYVHFYVLFWREDKLYYMWADLWFYFFVCMEPIASLSLCLSLSVSLSLSLSLSVCLAIEDIARTKHIIVLIIIIIIKEILQSISMILFLAYTIISWVMPSLPLLQSISMMLFLAYKDCSNQY